MLRRGLYKDATLVRRAFSSGSVLRNGVWSDFSKRPSSLKLMDEDIHKELFNGIDKDIGPLSIDNADKRLKYNSPEFIDDVFKLSYNFLEGESEKIYAKIDELTKQLESTTDEQTSKALRDEIDSLSVSAEKNNPEVLYNSEYLSDKLDTNQAVYRYFLKKKWKSYDLMVAMQRLEQLHVIPDTLPTLDPKADVRIKFAHNKDPEFADWVKPGTILPTFAVSQPPVIHIQEFDRVDGENLYTVVVVNPDAPDLATNSFKSELHYGLCNVPLNNADNTITISKLLEHENDYTFKSYQPLLPEKNAQTQRACLWVFRQARKLNIVGELSHENFDLRFFTKENDLLPIGAHVWRQTFDRSVNKVRSEYGLPKGRVFRRVRGTDPLA